MRLSDITQAAGDALLRAFPNLLVIDTEAIIYQARHIMEQIAQTLGAVFLFTLLSGLSVLYAALIATQDDRIHQSAIMRRLDVIGEICSPISRTFASSVIGTNSCAASSNT